MIRPKDALHYHADERPGKLEIKASKSVLSHREMRLAYLPGAAFPAAAIAAEAEQAYRYTARGNLVAVVSNGTAVPGLGDVGPLAAKPMLEGIAVLFKRLADIDVFDLELDTRDPERFVETVRCLEPTFGAINLKDIRAPEGLAIFDRLRDELTIPVLHENLYATAIVAMAALVNALDLAEKRIEDISVVICGAGTVGLGCARLLCALGLPASQVALYDLDGLLHPDRRDLSDYQRAFARQDAPRELAAGLVGADVFLGASVGGVLTQAMIRSMASFPIVFAMATPDPEIGYAEARAARRDVIVGTSSARDPNAIVDLLSFPYVLRGALDVQAATITEGMMLAAARALADLAREEVIDEVSRAYGYETFTFGPEYLLPKPIDPRILVQQSAAVAARAMQEGVARREQPSESYQEGLRVRLGTGRELMRQLMLKARQVHPRVVFPEGESETILRACALLVDEGIASPILLGDEARIARAAHRLALDVSGAAVIDPQKHASYEAYAEEFFRLRARDGVTRDMALARVGEPRHFATLMLHAGDASMMVSGVASHYAESMRTVQEVIGPAEGARCLSSLYMVLRPKQVYFLADCAVNIEPDAEQLAEIALLSAQLVRDLGIEPRVGMLSFSNFGSVDHPHAEKVRRAAQIARERAPRLIVDGELQLATALDAEMRNRYFPFSELQQDANVLIFPDLQSGLLALHLLSKLGDAVAVGPVLTGTRHPVHLLQYGASVSEVVNLVIMGAVQAASKDLSEGAGR
jgi:malate dehydrogenase (oxaloacetate-decarboxylating)(NADP+)